MRLLVVRLLSVCLRPGHHRRVSLSACLLAVASLLPVALLLVALHLPAFPPAHPPLPTYHPWPQKVAPPSRNPFNQWPKRCPPNPKRLQPCHPNPKPKQCHPNQKVPRPLRHPSRHPPRVPPPLACWAGWGRCENNRPFKRPRKRKGIGTSPGTKPTATPSNVCP